MADQTVIGFATSLTGFHELDSDSRSVSRPYALLIAVMVAISLVLTVMLAFTVTTQWTATDAVWKWAISSTALAIALSCLMATTLIPGTPRTVVLFGALLGLVCSAPGPIIALGWSSPSVRSAVLERQAVPVTTLPLALDDSDDSVAAAACRAIIAQRYQPGRQQLLQVLTSRPAIVPHCLQRNDEWSQELALPLLQTWAREFYSDDLGDTHTVARARTLPHLPAPTYLLDAAQIECAVRAAPDVAKACVAGLESTISAEAWPTRLEAMSAALSADGARAVVSMTFHSNSRYPTLQPLVAALETLSDRAKVATLRALGEMLYRGHWDVLRPIIGGIETDCVIDIDAIPQRLATWDAIVENSVQRHTDGTSISAALCKELHSTLTNAAITDASRLIDAAIRPPRSAETRAIDAGWLMNNPMTNQTLDGIDDRNAPPDLTPSQRAHWRELQKRGFQNRNNPLLTR